jgi:hypothetical protein
MTAGTAAAPPRFGAAGVFLTMGFLGAYHQSTPLLGVGYLAWVP